MLELPRKALKIQIFYRNVTLTANVDLSIDVDSTWINACFVHSADSSPDIVIFTTPNANNMQFCRLNPSFGRPLTTGNPSHAIPFVPLPFLAVGMSVQLSLSERLTK